jgi:hypothetical protein
LVKPSLLTHQFQAEPCRCSRRVASIIELIDLGCASNLMRVHHLFDSCIHNIEGAPAITAINVFMTLLPPSRLGLLP